MRLSGTNTFGYNISLTTKRLLAKNNTNFISHDSKHMISSKLAIFTLLVLLVCSSLFYLNDFYWNQILPNYYFFFFVTFSCIPLFLNLRQSIDITILDLCVLFVIITTIVTRWMRIFPIMDIGCFNGFVCLCFYLLLRQQLFSKRSFVYFMFGIGIFGFVLACHGLGQYIGWFYNDNTLFSITGTFPQPAPYACLLAVLSFSNLYFISSKSRAVTCVSIINWMFICVTIYLTGTRIALIVMILPSVLVWSPKINVRIRNTLSILVIIILIVLIFSLGKSSDSLLGRLLIWKVSLIHFFDSYSFTGIGHSFFDADYLLMQINYFSQNQFTSKEMLLADTSTEPFNEFIRFIIENGYMGIITVIISMIALIFYRRRLFLESKETKMMQIMLMSFVILSSLSYPLSFPIFKIILLLLIAFYSNQNNINYSIKLKKRYFLFTVFICLCINSFFSYREYANVVRWKKAWHNEYQKPKEAFTTYQEVYSDLRKNGKFLEAYGSYLYFLKKIKHSAQILDEAEKLHSSKHIYNSKVKVNEQLGNIKEVEKYLLKIIYANPKLFVPKYKLLQYYNRYDQLEKRNRLAKTIIDMPIKIKNPISFSVKKKAQSVLLCQNDKISLESL